MDTTNEVAFVLMYKDQPKMRVNLPLSATVGELKKRAVSEPPYDALAARPLSLRLGNMEMRDDRTLDTCNVKENCIVNVVVGNAN